MLGAPAGGVSGKLARQRKEINFPWIVRVNREDWVGFASHGLV